MTRILPKEPGESLPSQGSGRSTKEKKLDKMPKLIKMTIPSGLCQDQEVLILDFNGKQAEESTEHVLSQWPAALCGIEELKTLERINLFPHFQPLPVLYDKNPFPSRPPRLISISAVCERYSKWF